MKAYILSKVNWKIDLYIVALSEMIFGMNPMTVATSDFKKRNTMKIPQKKGQHHLAFLV